MYDCTVSQYDVDGLDYKDIRSNKKRVVKGRIYLYIDAVCMRKKKVES